MDKHIALDLDDCILDFTGGLRRSVALEYGVEVPEFTDWHIRDVLDPILGRSWWKWMRERDFLWKTFPAVPGAIGTISQLREAGYYIEIVTSKPEWAEASVWQWLGRWRPAVHRVTIVNDKTSKSSVTDALILVDDKPRNCIEWADTGRFAILFDRPHNRLTPGYNPLIVRAEGWQDVRKILAERMP